VWKDAQGLTDLPVARPGARVDNRVSALGYVTGSLIATVVLLGFAAALTYFGLGWV
jgi:hypothetical protein